MPDHGGTLAGKVALVTGGSRRIGKEIALRLARAGAAVAVNARTSRREVDAVVAEIAAAGGTAMPALADITDPQANAAMIDATVRSLGRLDIVVHSAVARERARLADLDLASWRAALAVALGPDGITVNLVSPGRIESEEDPAERRHELARTRPDDQIPLRRAGTPSDVADVVVALARSDFRYVTGQTIHVSGGFYMG